MKRIYSIDFARGLVMVIMALDHVRDLIHTASLTESPTNLQTTTPALFFTRWITYLCAPIFVFLSGTSAFLSFWRNRNVKETRRFLLKRGLWLILLELTVVNFGMFFDVGFHIFMLEVIAAFGFGFIILSLLLNQSARTIAIIGFTIFLLHDVYPLLHLTGPVSTFLNPFFVLSGIPLPAGRVLVVAYPPLPWLAIMLLGFAAGRFFLMESGARRKWFLSIGVSALVVFVLLRWTNWYGDPFPWSVQKSGLYTFLSFMNVSKYPPSLLFGLVTLGILFIVLYLSEHWNNAVTSIVRVYGKVPLFYFIVHFYVIHILLLIILMAQGFSWREWQFAGGTFGRPAGVPSGLSLEWVYVIWIVLVAALYYPCKWYGKYKSTHAHWWLRYL